jgi:hypothetical protein
MKALIAIFALLAGSQAMAAKDCTPYLQQMDGESGDTQYVYPCGADHTVTYRGCNEGEVAYDSVFNGEFYQQVAVVCHNGTFADPSSRAPVRHRGCTEGEMSSTSVFNGNFYEQRPVVCHHGRFVLAHR